MGLAVDGLFFALGVGATFLIFSGCFSFAAGGSVGVGAGVAGGVAAGADTGDGVA